MYKKIVLLFTVTTLLLYTNTLFAEDNKSVELKVPDSSFNDYYIVGLKAYEDKLNDVAKYSFENYLKNENKSQKAGFALYLLYQLYMADENYKLAQDSFTKLQNFNDSRFDKKKMLKDQMFIEVKLDCNGAKNLLLVKPLNEYMEVYIKSSCPVDQSITGLLGKADFTPDITAAVLDRVKNDKELVLSTYNNLEPKKKSDKLLNFYGHFFYANGMKDEFYELYKDYQNADLTDLVLNEAWASKNYDKYIEDFNKYAKPEFTLKSGSYCRMIEASNKRGVSFDCNLVDKCLGVKHKDYNKSKLACYMKQEDKKNIEKFLASISLKEAQKLCEYGKYIIGKDLYSINILDKFTNCPDKVSMFESLLKSKDYKGMILLGDRGKTQIDYAYLAIAYKLSGNMYQYNEYLNKVTDINLSGMVKRITK